MGAVDRVKVAKQKAERKLLGQLSRRLLADRAKLHHSYVCLILRGERRPSIDAAYAMSRALRISLDDFYARLRTLTNGRRTKQGSHDRGIESLKGGRHDRHDRHDRQA